MVLAEVAAFENIAADRLVPPLSSKAKTIEAAARLKGRLFPQFGS